MVVQNKMKRFLKPTDLPKQQEAVVEKKDSKDVEDSGTFRFQEKLPKLPVPDLEVTCKTFLESVEPLLNSEELVETRNTVDDLLNNQGPEMQKALLKYAETQDNYVDAFWDDAYLLMDDPIVVNVNPFFVLEDDLTPGGKDQVLRATNIVVSAIKFVHSIRTETMKVDMVRKTPLCMSQYPKVMGSCRIPHGRGVGNDKIVTTEDSTHIVVMCRNQFYYFDVVTEDGKMVISPENIAENLESIKEDASMASDQEAVECAVGALTSQTRTKWAKYRHLLEEESVSNKKSLKIIDEALFVLCLDMDSPRNLDEASANALRGTTRENEDGVQTGTCLSRWYDKLMFIVCENGTAQVNFEHAPADGHSVLRVVSDIFTDTIIKFAQSISGKAHVDSHLKSARYVAQESSSETEGSDKYYCTETRKMEFDINDEIKSGIIEAQDHLLRDWINKYSIKSLEYTRYGKKFITSNKLSPDAYVQMSMMAATHKVCGELPNGYESVMTKAFLKGRTEAGRPVTSKAKAYVEMINNNTGTDAEKTESLRHAAAAHSQMTSRCSKGLGVDRHLYALKCCHRMDNKEAPLPAFFSSPGYHKLGCTVLSTSNCGNPALKLFGFGPVSEHGIGIGYIIKDKGISFSLCSKSISVDDTIEALTTYLNETQKMLKKSSNSSGRLSMKRIRRSTARPGFQLKKKE